MKVLNKWEITKIEKTEAEETKKETEEKKGDKKKMKKSTKGGLIALTVAAVGAGVYGVKTYLDSRKEDSYASLDSTDSDVEDEVEDLDQEETNEEETD